MGKTLFCVLWLSASSAFAQGSAGSSSNIEPRSLIDTPTAGLLDRGAFGLDIDFYQDGGVLLNLSAGVLERLNFGISYGGSNIIGSKKVEWNKLPGVNIKFRVWDETELMPAIVAGFDSQGKEAYIDSTDRYTIKSRGFFAAASKNYAILGNLSIHGGLNYSLERADGDRDINFFAGAEKTLGPDISIIGEYDFGLNDNNRSAIGKGHGYLNLGVRWSVGNGFTLGFDLKNLVKNRDQITIGNRTLKIEYVRLF